MKKVVVLGGGTGQSVLLKGLKEFPLDITAVVSVSDDGKGTGKLRNEFNIPAVGDIRRVLVALSETEDLVGKLINYRFNTSSDLDGQTIGNLMLASLSDICGNISSATEQMGNVLNLKGKVLPLTDDYITLMGEMEDGSIIEGEHNITLCPKKIKKVFYKEEPKVYKNVIKAISESDAIVLSMGSVYTSIIPNLIPKSIKTAISKSKAKIIYICNLMTQPGETDNFTVSDHINLINEYLGKRKIEYVITNSEKISKKTLKLYETKEQKDLVRVDKENIKVKHINEPFVKIENDLIRHDSFKLALEIMNIVAK